MRLHVRPSRLIVAAFAVTLLLVELRWPRFLDPNEASRLYLLEAIVDGATLTIDGPLARHGDMEDKLVFAGHSYSNKPPGIAALALPGYAAARLVARASGEPLRIGPALRVARIGAVALPVVVFLWAFALHLERRGIADPLAAALVAGVGFGTGLLPWGATLTAHATSAALIGLAALALAQREQHERWLALAAVLLGLAAATEYPATVPGAVLLLAALARHPSGRAIAGVALGLLPGAALALGYNTAVFGNPFDLGYGHHVNPGFAAIHGQGLVGFGWPRPTAMWGLAGSPSRGLFAWSPVLLLALPGAVALFRERRGREAAGLAGAALALVLFIAGYPNWHGGWSLGPRYLVAVVPLLALLAAAAVELRPGPRQVLPGLAAASIALHGVALFTFPFFPDLLDSPLRTLTLPLLQAGAVASGVALVAMVAAAGALASALRPAPLRGLVLASAWVGALAIAPEDGPAPFVQGEVLWLTGRDALARARFEQVLERERPSPAMADHARRRLETIYRDAGAAGAGSNIGNRSQPER